METNSCDSSIDINKMFPCLQFYQFIISKLLCNPNQDDGELESIPSVTGRVAETDTHHSLTPRANLESPVNVMLMWEEATVTGENPCRRRKTNSELSCWPLRYCRAHIHNSFTINPNEEWVLGLNVELCVFCSFALFSFLPGSSSDDSRW